jgi:predicted NodU family carbamoyl transferase
MDRAALIAAMQQAAEAAIKPRPVEVPAWGTVYVRDVTVSEVDGDTDDVEADKTTRLARAACRVLCDDAGVRLFDARNAQDVALLSGQPWSVLQKVLAKADSTGNG